MSASAGAGVREKCSVARLLPLSAKCEAWAGSVALSGSGCKGKSCEYRGWFGFGFDARGGEASGCGRGDGLAGCSSDGETSGDVGRGGDVGIEGDGAMWARCRGARPSCRFSGAGGGVGREMLRIEREGDLAVSADVDAMVDDVAVVDVDWAGEGGFGNAALEVVLGVDANCKSGRDGLGGMKSSSAI